MGTLDALIGGARNILHMPAKAACAFERNQDLLISEFEAAITAQRNSSSLVGVRNFPGLIYENPRFYTQFMTNVLNLNHAELLVKVVAWGYRTSKHRGVHVDYFRWAFRLWREAVRTHLDIEDAAQIIKVYDWLLDHHLEFIEVAESSVAILVPQFAGWDKPHQSLLTLLLQGDTTGSLQLVKSQVSSPHEYQQFCLQVVQPVMYEIGRLWEIGTITVAQEHLATSVLSRVTASLYGVYVVGDSRKGKAIVSAVLNEFHELGARMAADFLEMDGWEVYYLGAGSSLDEFSKMIQKVKPNVVGLSVIMPFNLDSARQMVQVIRLKRARTKVFIGGPTAMDLSDAFSGMGADAYGNSATDLLIWSREIWKAKRRVRNGK